MIEIITLPLYESLDLKPDTDFEITIEQPMLDDSHTPIPYSTSITFMPTATNNNVFGYINAMMLEPTVKELSVMISCSGIPLFYGVLEYENIDDDGSLNYVFAGRSLEDDFQDYIHNVNHFTKAYHIDHNTPNALDLIKSARKGSNAEFGAPMLLNKDNITDIEYSNTLEKEPVEQMVKYHNYIWSVKSIFTPAVKVKAMFVKIFENIDIDDSFRDIYNNLAILGLHKDVNIYSMYGMTPDENGALIFDVANSLPEIKIYDFIVNLAKMLCGTIFRKGDRYTFLSNSAVLSSKSYVDWNNRISDVFSATSEKASSYVFSYNNEDSDNTFDTLGANENSNENNFIDVSTMNDVLAKSLLNDNYVATRNTNTGDMYSGRRIGVYLTEDMTIYPFLDMILHKVDKVEIKAKTDSSFDCNVDFKIPRCIPTLTYRHNDPTIFQKCMCPIITPSAIGDTRPNEVIIGLLLNNQFVDKGVVYPQPTLNPTSDTESEDNKFISIAPEALYSKFHKEYAEWITKDKQVISGNVNLSIYDISNLEMYKKVLFRYRAWLIKSISFSFNTSSDTIDSSADFIEI